MSAIEIDDSITVQIGREFSLTLLRTGPGMVRRAIQAPRQLRISRMGVAGQELAPDKGLHPQDNVVSDASRGAVPARQQPVASLPRGVGEPTNGS